MPQEQDNQITLNLTVTLTGIGSNVEINTDLTAVSMPIPKPSEECPSQKKNRKSIIPNYIP